MLKFSQPEAEAPNVNSRQALQPHVVVHVQCRCTFVVHVMLHQIIDDATVLTPGPDDDHQ